MSVPLWAWSVTVVGVGLLLAGELVVHRVAKPSGLRRAAVESALWIVVSLLFGVLLGVVEGFAVAGQYFSGYLLEKSLSVDNVLAFALIFRSLAVPLELQRGVLEWGVVGALVLRGAYIAGGSAFIGHVSWAFYVFGAIVLVAGIRMGRGGAGAHPRRSLVLRTLRRVLPVSTEFSGRRFFTSSRGRLTATPLLVALVAIEATDVLFATDSIPAIFGVTTNVFVVFTSNAFAVLGLRSLYFVLATAMGRFVYLTKGLAALLVLIGVKMLLQSIVRVPTAINLAAILVVLSASVGLSLAHERRGRGDVSIGGHVPRSH